MKRVIKQKGSEGTSNTESEVTVQNKHQKRLRFNQETPFILGQLWKNYDIEGNGMLDTAEARHFLDNHLKNDYGIERLSDSDFDTWFRQIDNDGDGKVDTVLLALAV